MLHEFNDLLPPMPQLLVPDGRYSCDYPNAPQARTLQQNRMNGGARFLFSSVERAGCRILKNFAHLNPSGKKVLGPARTPAAPNFGHQVFLPLANSLATASLDRNKIALNSLPGQLGAPDATGGVDADIAAAAGHRAVIMIVVRVSCRNRRRQAASARCRAILLATLAVQR